MSLLMLYLYLSSAISFALLKNLKDSLCKPRSSYAFPSAKKDFGFVLQIILNLFFS